ncbi:hypothetical protein BT93_C0713 [Corymbia citriodora subsp. variegata]|nr:hypothetical protein BT93_C0713 [Corymbia citriodora subsp. variegata]
MSQLNLSDTGIEELLEFIDSLKELKALGAIDCASLARTPSSVGYLASLLDLRNFNRGIARKHWESTEFEDLGH